MKQITIKISSSTTAMNPVRCVQCGRIIGYAEGKASIKCRHCKTITLYLEGQTILINI